MKLFEIPMVIATLLGFCFLPDPQVPAARADFTFGKRVDLGPTVDSSQGEGNLVISRNGLELYFYSNRPGGYGSGDIWMSKRASGEDPWGPAVNLGPGINSAADENPESISSDGLTLYISGGRPDYEIYTATRPAMEAPWAPRVKMSPVLGRAHFAIISPDDLELYVYSNRAGGLGGYDVWVNTRATPNDPWEPPVNPGPTINTSGSDAPESMSPDGLILFIGSDRPGGFGSVDMWMARRPSKSAAWTQAVNLGPSFNTPGNENMTSISADGRWIYVQNLAGAVWMVPIIPIVDFNGDGKVDGKDVLCMVAHWGTDDSVCDVGPFAWGDGTVGLEDLTVLAEYLGKEVADPTMIAHWALDETEGSIAGDSAGDKDGTLSGGPLWQPESGQVDGALQFDGVDDCVITPFIVNPADGPFSVLAWVKGGIPGQVVLSQIDSADWLCADPSEGRLMTSLVPPAGRIVPPPLVSELVITDGNWHRIGFAWDGSHRHLYVDGAEVAKDAAPLSGLESANGGLYFGAGSTLTPGTFWFGLIDDVRIYERAVRP